MSLAKFFVFLNRKYNENDNIRNGTIKSEYKRINTINYLSFILAVILKQIVLIINLIITLEFLLYKNLPLRILSRTWGAIASVKLPVILRSPILSVYVKIFGVKMDEALKSNLEEYDCLSELFSRKLKADARQISRDDCVCPCDGVIVSCGRIYKGSKLEKVKGIAYDLDQFLGETIKCESDMILHQCIIYLAPGDYHRFHAPCDWTVLQREHFPGKLLSVSPWAVRIIPGLFCMNERVVYGGKWKHGFFSMTAVGATNVGSICVYGDEKLQTNVRTKSEPEILRFKKLRVKKADLFGHFNMGSTVVLVFEAPKNFKFIKTVGDRVRMGETLIME